ncbi:hypothetical protein E4490_22335 [Escherichia coli]|nr:hypothetical protein [Escherichia coli]QJZ64405.1 hypothetical protein E3171_25745 [Escherichia coli O55:H7]MCI5357876.1 hypothetical protein [Escherichia coli]QKB25784.1 hypothetical protein E3158_27925 [Escherichia coli O55:H7]QKB30782.1 hypothetical protein E3157_25705 [Escherichia coli O55:H7]
MTDFRGKTSIFSHPVYLFLRKFSLQDSRGGSLSKTSSAAFQRCHHLSSPAGTGVPLVVQPFAIALKIQTWATVVIECGLQEF